MPQFGLGRRVRFLFVAFEKSPAGVGKFADKFYLGFLRIVEIIPFDLLNDVELRRWCDRVFGTLLRDADLDLRSAACDDDRRRAGFFGIVGFKGDFQRVGACGVAVVGRYADPVGGFGAGLGDCRGPCPFGREGHALSRLRVVGPGGLFQLAGVRDLDLPEIARVIVVFVAA